MRASWVKLPVYTLDQSMTQNVWFAFHLNERNLLQVIRKPSYPLSFKKKPHYSIILHQSVMVHYLFRGTFVVLAEEKFTVLPVFWSTLLFQTATRTLMCVKWLPHLPTSQQSNSMNANHFCNVSEQQADG